MRTFIRSLLPVCAAMALTPWLPAADATEPPADEEENVQAATRKALAALEQQVDATYEAAKKAQAGKEDTLFVAKGVRADKTARTVEIDAHTTGLSRGSIAEFYLITLNSGHEYEALFQTFALGADIRRAFDFIGMEPGRTVDYNLYRYWSAGERLEATVAMDGVPAMPLADLIQDAQTDRPYADRTFVYLGGAWLEKDKSLDVDSSGPGSLISAYNEKITILDVPRMAMQTEVYESNVIAKHAPTNAWAPAVITFKPEARPEGAPLRVRDLTLTLKPDGISLDGAEPVSATEAVQALRDMREKQRQDVYLSVRWDDTVAIRDLRAMAQLLDRLDSADTGVRVDAPPAGFPYVKAFLPQEAWRDREQRFSQPCELRFAAPAEEGAAPAVTLVAITETWRENSLKPDLSATDIPVSSVDAFPALLQKHSPPDIGVLLVFVPGSLPYAAVRPWLDAVRDTHSLVQIFVD